MVRWRWAAILLVLVLLVLAAGCGALRPTPTPGQPTSIADQIYVSQLSNTVLQVLSPEKVASQPTKGDLLDFKSGEIFTTAETGNGYAQLGFPGQVEVYLASGAEMALKDPTDAGSKGDIVLKNGLLMVRLPETFSKGQRFALESPDGARVWVSGSVIGLQYDPANKAFYADCVLGHCGYADSSGEQSLPEGSHVSLNGKKVLSVGAGMRNELWQFVPNMVAAPTLVPSVTPNLAGTQACRYFTSLGLSCEAGFPTVTITPSPTANFQATQACQRSVNLGTPCP